MRLLIPSCGAAKPIPLVSYIILNILRASVSTWPDSSSSSVISSFGARSKGWGYFSTSRPATSPGSSSSPISLGGVKASKIVVCSFSIGMLLSGSSSMERKLSTGFLDLRRGGFFVALAGVPKPPPPPPFCLLAANNGDMPGVLYRVGTAAGPTVYNGTGVYNEIAVVQTHLASGRATKPRAMPSKVAMVVLEHGPSFRCSTMVFSPL
mmetsp:Transcript_19215/g.33977  ORF Transcript_19215/g.33977 Transcript_19215/m.33977 type:complete len:208 (+) Transcript_19215:1569-2192(+)